MIPCRFVVHLLFLYCVFSSLQAAENSAPRTGPDSGFILREFTPEQTSQFVPAVRALIKRRVPGIADRFELAVMPREGDHDQFEVVSLPDDRIGIHGSTGVAMATGFNWYLKHLCHRWMTWCGSDIESLTPSDLKPVPNGKFRCVLPNQKVVYLNYCTLSYSMAWWDWKRWQSQNCYSSKSLTGCSSRFLHPLLSNHRAARVGKVVVWPSWFNWITRHKP